jgi:hypothetical protein
LKEASAHLSGEISSSVNKLSSESFCDNWCDSSWFKYHPINPLLDLEFEQDGPDDDVENGCEGDGL